MQKHDTVNIFMIWVGTVQSAFIYCLRTDSLMDQPMMQRKHYCHPLGLLKSKLLQAELFQANINMYLQFT